MIIRFFKSLQLIQRSMAHQNTIKLVMLALSMSKFLLNNRKSQLQKKNIFVIDVPFWFALIPSMKFFLNYYSI